MQKMSKKRIVILVIITIVFAIIALFPFISGEAEELQDNINHLNEKYVFNYISNFEWSVQTELVKAELNSILIRSIVFGIFSLISGGIAIITHIKSKDQKEGE